MGVVIGIDLGTTYSAAGWFIDGKAQILMLEGEATLPSVLSRLRGGNIAVGRAAKRNQIAMPHDTIVEVKRQMGAGFSDAWRRHRTSFSKPSGRAS